MEAGYPTAAFTCTQAWRRRAGLRNDGNGGRTDRDFWMERESGRQRRLALLLLSHMDGASPFLKLSVEKHEPLLANAASAMSPGGLYVLLVTRENLAAMEGHRTETEKP